MRLISLKGLLLACAGITVGCGGSSSPTTGTTPPTPAPPLFPPGSVLSIHSGYDGAPVAGADVRIGATSFRSDAVGRVVLPDGAARDAMLEVTAQDFLVRRTRLSRAEDLAVALWPAEIRRIGLDQEMTKLLLHERLESRGQVDPMRRIAVGTTAIYLWPDASLRADARAMAAAATAAERLAASVQIPFHVVDQQPAGGFVIEIRQGTLQTPCVTCATTRTGLNSWEVIGGLVHIGNAGMLHPSVWIHEVGHVIGLNHSPRVGVDVMAEGLRGLSDFSELEMVTLRMTLKRLPGKLFPDDDAAAPRYSSRGSGSLIVCDFEPLRAGDAGR